MPKITGDSLSAHREQIRERVFAAFTELVAERGFEAITMAQLAERAGVGRTSIYHHFKDKTVEKMSTLCQDTQRGASRTGGRRCRPHPRRTVALSGCATTARSGVSR